MRPLVINLQLIAQSIIFDFILVPSRKSLTNYLLFGRLLTLLTSLLAALTLLINSGQPDLFTQDSATIKSFIICSSVIIAGCMLQLVGYFTGLTALGRPLNTLCMSSIGSFLCIIYDYIMVVMTLNTLLTVLISFAGREQWSMQSVYIIYGILSAPMMLIELAKLLYFTKMNRKRSDCERQESISRQRLRTEAVSKTDSTITTDSIAIARDDFGDEPIRMRVLSADSYQRPGVPFQRPVELTCFSYDSERRQHMNDSELKYFYPLDLQSHEQCNLGAGFPDLYQPRDESIPEHLDALLIALEHISPRLGTLLDSDAINPNYSGDNNPLLVTWRGIMTKILCTPYSSDRNSGEDWLFAACRVNGVIYMEEPLDFRLATKQDRYDDRRQKEMMFWGYRFESLCTIDCHPRHIQNARNDPRLTDRYKSVVNTNVQYCSVVKTRLGKHGLIMGAEVDCQVDDKVPNDSIRNYVELKTSKLITNDREKRTFERFKLLKFYVQSFLVGIPKIIVGFRDGKGQVKKLETIETLKIPRQVRHQGYWDPYVCLNFADEFIGFLKQQILNDDLDMVYRIEYSTAKREIVLTRSTDPSWKFIPTSYKPFNS